jgi:hypothetical protein
MSTARSPDPTAKLPPVYLETPAPIVAAEKPCQYAIAPHAASAPRFLSPDAIAGIAADENTSVRTRTTLVTTAVVIAYAMSARLSFSKALSTPTGPKGER